MKKIIYLSFLFFLLISNFSLAQWELRNTGISGVYTARAIDAVDSNIAVAAYVKQLFKTENAGLNWVNITPPNDSDFVDVSVIDNTHFWVTTEKGKILSTTDGGINWVVQFYDVQKTNFMNYIEMFDINNGIAMGDASNNNIPALFLRTTDGGNNWISVNNGYLKGGASDRIWKKLDFIDINYGYFGALTNTDDIYKTTDGGQSWTRPIEGLASQLFKFYNKDIGIIVPYSGVLGKKSLIRTFNGLSTVDTIKYINSFWTPADIEFFPGDPSKIFYLDWARLFFSNDTGKTWQVALDSSKAFGGRDIVLTDKNHGWLICNNSKVFYISNNDIITDIENEVNTIPNKFILAQNYPNPFNPTTTISYSIPKGSFVTLTIYDVLGRKVKTLVNKFQTAGNYKVSFNAEGFTSGVYIYRIKVGNFAATKKLVLMK